MGKEDRVGISTGSLEQCEFSLDQLLGQEEHQSDFASYLAGVNQRRSELEFDELTGNETGVKLAFAFKTNQLELRHSALDYLEARGNLLDQGVDLVELSLDLAACDLLKTDLERADLRWADLEGADLREADLGKADLRGARFRWADFRQADLRQADLRRADLRQADLTGADLSWAKLERADLSGTDLRQINFWQANLWQADLTEADLRGADLRRARYLGCITASEADFTGARLRRTELKALNKLDRKQGNLLAGASGLIRNESGRITGVESLPDPKPETPKIQNKWAKKIE